MKENLLVMISISSSNKDKLKDISNKISKTFVKHIILYHIRNYIQKEKFTASIDVDSDVYITPSLVSVEEKTSIKDIVIEYQTKEQIEALKQTARFYKKRIIKREEENS